MTRSWREGAKTRAPQCRKWRTKCLLTVSLLSVYRLIYSVACGFRVSAIDIESRSPSARCTPENYGHGSVCIFVFCIGRDAQLIVRVSSAIRDVRFFAFAIDIDYRRRINICRRIERVRERERTITVACRIFRSVIKNRECVVYECVEKRQKNHQTREETK